MGQDTVILQLYPGKDGEILIAVGGPGDQTASADDVEVEWDDAGMLRVKLADGKREVPLKCVANGDFAVDDLTRRVQE